MREIEGLIDSGNSLELFTASYFQARGYYVETNLKWIEGRVGKPGNVDVLELDVLAKGFAGDVIKTILVECKRGAVFTDLFKFVGIARMIEADEDIFVCQGNHVPELKKHGAGMGIGVWTPEDMLPAFERGIFKDWFLRFFASNSLCGRIFDKDIIKLLVAPDRVFTDMEQSAYNAIRKYSTELIGKVWREPDAVDQAAQIKKLLDDHKDFVRGIARMLKVKPGNKASEYYMRDNALCEAAGYLVLKIKVSYVVCAVQCAHHIARGTPLDLDRVGDDSFINVVQLLCGDIELARRVPWFLQGFIHIFGGMAYQIGDTDVGNIAEYLGFKRSDIYEMIKLLRRLFSMDFGGAAMQWGFVDDLGVTSIKYVPYPLKGMGIRNREMLGFSIEGFGFADEWNEKLSIYGRGEMWNY